MLDLNSDVYSDGEGDGPPLLLIHGLFGSATNWRGIARRLGARRRVIATDLRNHGRSPHDPRMTYRDMADDLVGLIDKLDVSAVDMLGHSMGGKAAMLLALHHPQMVARLIVVDIAPVAYGHSHAGLIASMAALDLENLKSRSDADRKLSVAVPDTPTRLFLLQNLTQEAGRFRWRLNLAALDSHMPDILGFPEMNGAAYPGPCMFIGGERSDYIRASHDPVIRTHFPNAQMRTIAQAGHWVHADQPDALVEAVEGFLD